MPVPFLLAGLGVAAGIVGAGGHINAKEINEKAEIVSEEAQNIYNNAKESLEVSQNKTEKALLNLGYSKKNVLENSIKQFLNSYDKIKHIKFKNSVGIYEISKFTIDKQEVIQLREMSDIYESTFSSGTTGVAAGAVIALAASGSLPVVTGALSTAGTVLMAGEVGAAAGIAGSALSFGAAMTPLAAIAAPALLFTGISSSIKADENFEKAKCMYAEAEVAYEKMQTAETLCTGIIKKSDMFNELLRELDVMFAECVGLLENVVVEKKEIFKKEIVSSSDFTEQELKLIAVTRSLAGAVKSVIDTPILTKDGELFDKIEDVYNETSNMLPEFKQRVQEVESYDFNFKNKAIKRRVVENTMQSSSGVTIPNFFVLVIAIALTIFSKRNISDSNIITSMIFAIVTLSKMNLNDDSKFFTLIKRISCAILAIDFSILLYYNFEKFTNIRFFIIIDIILGVVFLLIAISLLPKQDEYCDNTRKLFRKIFSCMFFFACALLIYKIVVGLIGFSATISTIFILILFIPFALLSVFTD